MQFIRNLIEHEKKSEINQRLWKSYWHDTPANTVRWNFAKSIFSRNFLLSRKHLRKTNFPRIFCITAASTARRNTKHDVDFETWEIWNLEVKTTTFQASGTLKLTNWTNLEFFCLRFSFSIPFPFFADLVRHYRSRFSIFSRFYFLHHSSSSSVVTYRKVTTFNEKHKMCNIQNYTRRRMDGWMGKKEKPCRLCMKQYVCKFKHFSIVGGSHQKWQMKCFYGDGMLYFFGGTWSAVRKFQFWTFDRKSFRIVWIVCKLLPLRLNMFRLSFYLSS